MRAALVLLSLGSVAAFGGAKVIAGCLDSSATNYNTPGPVTLSVPGMCQYNPAPPAPPSAPGRYGRASTLGFEPASNPNPPAHARSLFHILRLAKCPKRAVCMYMYSTSVRIT